MIKALILTQLSAVASSMDTATPLADRLALGGRTLVFNLAIVMAVLAILWGSLEIFRVIFYELPKKRAAKNTETPASQLEQSLSLPEQTPNEPAPAEAEADDSELAAAITAAVYAYLDCEAKSEGKPAYAGGFRVVSFRKK